MKIKEYIKELFKEITILKHEVKKYLNEKEMRNEKDAEEYRRIMSEFLRMTDFYSERALKIPPEKILHVLYNKDW